jgi:hypothetical protein
MLGVAAITGWDTFMMRSDQTGMASNTLQVRDEVWWKSLGEGGNGDIDAKIEVGPLYLDAVVDMFASAFFIRIDTGERGGYHGVIWF